MIRIVGVGGAWEARVNGEIYEGRGWYADCYAVFYDRSVSGCDPSWTATWLPAAGDRVHGDLIAGWSVYERRAAAVPIMAKGPVESDVAIDLVYLAIGQMFKPAAWRLIKPEIEVWTSDGRTAPLSLFVAVDGSSQPLFAAAALAT